MRITLTVLSLAMALVLGASLAQAQPPVNGTYKTLNGDFHEGRYSVSWTNGAELQSGNVLDVESWDGSVLGTEWRIYCPIAVTETKLYDSVSGGNGQQIWRIDYTGGTVWLSGTGPWGGGDPSYTGAVSSYTEVRTIQYVGGAVVGENSNHNVSAQLVGYSANCVAFAIGNTAWYGDTNGGPKPLNYPDFLDSNCGPNGTLGLWGSATDLTLTVQGCVTPVQESTWGSVKARYR